MNKQDIHAFPSPTIDADNGSKIYGNLGMTLRDYFAAQAMQGFIASQAWHPDFVFPEGFNFDAGKRADESVAAAAYKYADEMLKARDK